MSSKAQPRAGLQSFPPFTAATAPM